MNIGDAVKLSEEASRFIEERTDRTTAAKTCLALEEILTGIVLANKDDAKGAIDVSLMDKDDEVVISVRDLGVGFNPLVRDENLDYRFDNASVLQSISTEIRMIFR